MELLHYRRKEMGHTNIWIICWEVAHVMHVVCAQSGPTLCDPLDHNPAGSLSPWASPARTLEWVAISFSRWSSWSRDWTCLLWRGISHGRLIEEWQWACAVLFQLFRKSRDLVCLEFVGLQPRRHRTKKHWSCALQECKMGKGKTCKVISIVKS